MVIIGEPSGILQLRLFRLDWEKYLDGINAEALLLLLSNIDLLHDLIMLKLKTATELKPNS